MVCCPKRLVVFLMLFLTMFFMYMLRANFSVIMLAMTIERDANGTVIEMPDYGPRYDWSVHDEALMLGAYFWGYAITSIPLGILTDRYNYAKLHIAAVMAASIALTVVTPWAAASIPATIALRFLGGFLQGGIVPAANKIIAQWAPPAERSKFVTFLFGCDIGTVFTWSLCGWMIQLCGWRCAFWTCAALAAGYVIVWLFVMFDTPAEHPRIAAQEREYIERALVGVSGRAVGGCPPFGRMLRSMPFWALLWLHFGHIWGMYTVLNEAPKFLNTVLKFDLRMAGALSGLPYLVRMVMGVVFGVAGDCIEARKLVRASVLRKFATLVSHVLPGIILLLIPYVGSDPYACVGMLTLSFFFNGAVSITNYRNTQDLAPNYASTIYAIINTAATCSGFLSPLVVSGFTAKRNTITEWSYVFMVGAGMYVVPAIFFMIFGSAEVQPWNEPKVKVDREKGVESAQKL